MFDHMVALQDPAFEAIKPGARCADVDRAVRTYYEKHDLWEYWKHHVGHCDRPPLSRRPVPRHRR